MLEEVKMMSEEVKMMSKADCYNCIQETRLTTFVFKYLIRQR